MLKVEVNEEKVHVSQRGDYTFYEQDAWCTFYNREGKLNPHPERITIQLDKDQPAYAVGSYVLHPASLYRNRYGRIEIGRIQLVSAKQADLKVANG